MKYFEERKSKIKLSEYLEESIKHEKGLEKWFGGSSNLHDTSDRIKLLLEKVGDIEANKELISAYVDDFGLNDNEKGIEYANELVDFVLATPNLSRAGYDLIYTYYVKTMFEENDFLGTYKSLIEKYNKNDETFNIFIEILKRTTEKYEKEYQQEARKANEDLQAYPKAYSDYVQEIIKKKFVKYEDLKQIIPNEEIVSRDYQQVSNLSIRYRLMQYIPLTKTLLDYMIKEQDLSDITDDSLKYSVSIGEKQKFENATFTKEEYFNDLKTKKRVRV